MYRAPQGGQAELLDEAARKEQEGQLREAAREGGLATVLSLLIAKADVNAACDDGKTTPLSEAVAWRHTPVARRLLEAKADATVVDRDGLRKILARQGMWH
jgi:ankyrin repeat protein